MAAIFRIGLYTVHFLLISLKNLLYNFFKLTNTYKQNGNQSASRISSLVYQTSLHFTEGGWVGDTLRRKQKRFKSISNLVNR